MSDRKHIRRTLAGVMLLAGLGFVVTACDQAPPPPPAKSTPTATSQPTAAELASVRALVQDQAPPATQQPQLPAGHPPIPSQMPAAGDTGMMSPPAAVELKYTVPGGWIQEPVRSAMRKSQYRLPRAEGDKEDGVMTVFYFGPGGAGGIDANIQRWRGQFTGADGGPLPDSAFKQEQMDANGLKITVVELHGQFGSHTMGVNTPDTPTGGEYEMLGAIVETPGGPWFFKALGPPATMQKQRAGFLDMLKTMKTD
jgi:hypothetical protein